jgi:hypothetical protein
LPVRAGKTLIEVVLVLGMAMTIALAGAQLIHMMMQAERAGAASLATGQTLDRLARTFREDVHAANGGPAEAGQRESLQLQLAGKGSVVYQATANRVDRTARDDAGNASHETFALPSSSISFESTPGGDILSLVVRRSATTTAKPASNVAEREFRITAVGGRDFRFVEALDQSQ